MRTLAIFFAVWPSLALAQDPLPPDLLPMKPELPRVVLRSDREVTLEQLDDRQRWDVASFGFPVFSVESEQWATTCEAPCNQRVVRRATYRVTGDGIITSDRFTLPKHGDRILLDVKAGSATVRRAGWATLLVGIPVAVVGFVAGTLSLAVAGGNPNDPTFAASAAGSAIGLSLVITSIPLLVGSRTVISAEVR